MRATLLCYADGAPVHLRNQEALVRSARGKGFDAVLACGRDDLAAEFRREHRHILERRRGAGYWLWKPYLVERCLRRGEPGDVLVYLDAGMTIRRPLHPLIEQTTRLDLVLFQGTRPNSQHVKRDCFVLTGTDVPECHGALQVDANAMLVKNTNANRRFVRLWLDYCMDARVLTDAPNQCGEPALPGFAGHRHDQAVLSVLYWRERSRLTHLLGDRTWKERYFLHHRRRNDRVPIPLWPYYDGARQRWRAARARLGALLVGGARSGWPG